MGLAQVWFVTKSGTNQVHGGVFWQHRNDFFESNYYFHKPERPAARPDSAEPVRWATRRSYLAESNLLRAEPCGRVLEFSARIDF